MAFGLLATRIWTCPSSHFSQLLSDGEVEIDQDHLQVFASLLFSCVRSFVQSSSRFDSVRFGPHTHPFVYSQLPSQSSVSSAIRSGNVNAWMQTVLSTVSTLGDPSSTRLAKGKSLQASVTRRLLQSSSETDSASEERATRLQVKQLLANSVVEMASASYGTTESLRQQLQLVSEILRYPQEIDASLRKPLFAFIEQQVSMLYTDDDLETDQTVTLAILTSFSNMLTALTSDQMAAVSNCTLFSAKPTPATSNSSLCAGHLLEEAENLAAVISQAILKLTQKQLQNKVAGAEADASAAGTMCVISQRNNANSFSDISASACGAAFSASTNVNETDSNSTVPVAPSFSMPTGALMGISNELDMVVVINMQDQYKFADSLSKDEIWYNLTNWNEIPSSNSSSIEVDDSDLGSASGLVSITFNYPKMSASQGGQEFVVQNLTEPIQITIPLTRPLPAWVAVDIIPRFCQWWDEQKQSYSQEGCVVNMMLSTREYTVCECTHLTEFRSAFERKFDQLLELGNIGDTRLEDLIPTLEVLTTADLGRVTIQNLMKQPTSFFFIVCLGCSFLLLLPVTYLWDQKRKRKFVDEFVFNIDESFTQPEVGCAKFTVDELLLCSPLERQLKWTNVNDSWSHCIGSWAKCYQCRARKRDPKITIQTEEVAEHLVFTVSVTNLTNTHIFSKPSPVVGLFVHETASEEYLPYARTEMQINTSACSFKRKLIIPSPPSDMEDLKVMFVVYDDVIHHGEVEDVDPLTNEIFMSERFDLSYKWLRYRVLGARALWREHKWLAVRSKAIHDVYSMERLVSIVASTVTLFLAAAMFVSGQGETSTPSLLVDLSLSVWLSLCSLPAYSLVQFIFKRTGPVNRISLYVDLNTMKRAAAAAFHRQVSLMQELAWMDTLPFYFTKHRTTLFSNVNELKLPPKRGGWVPRRTVIGVRASHTFGNAPIRLAINGPGTARNGLNAVPEDTNEVESKRKSSIQWGNIFTISKSSSVEPDPDSASGSWADTTELYDDNMSRGTSPKDQGTRNSAPAKIGAQGLRALRQGRHYAAVTRERLILPPLEELIAVVDGRVKEAEFEDGRQCHQTPKSLSADDTGTQKSMITLSTANGFAAPSVKLSFLPSAEELIEQLDLSLPQKIQVPLSSNQNNAKRSIIHLSSLDNDSHMSRSIPCIDVPHSALLDNEAVSGQNELQKEAEQIDPLPPPPVPPAPPTPHEYINRFRKSSIFFAGGEQVSFRNQLGNSVPSANCAERDVAGCAERAAGALVDLNDGRLDSPTETADHVASGDKHTKMIIVPSRPAATGLGTANQLPTTKHEPELISAGIPLSVAHRRIAKALLQEGSQASETFAGKSSPDVQMDQKEGLVRPSKVNDIVSFHHDAKMERSRLRRIRVNDRFIRMRGLMPGIDHSGKNLAHKYRKRTKDGMVEDPLLLLYFSVPCFRWKNKFHCEITMPFPDTLKPLTDVILDEAELIKKTSRRLGQSVHKRHMTRTPLGGLGGKTEPWTSNVLNKKTGMEVLSSVDRSDIRGGSDSDSDMDSDTDDHGSQRCWLHRLACASLCLDNSKFI